MKNLITLFLFLISFTLLANNQKDEKKSDMPVYQDIPFKQDYSIKYLFEATNEDLYNLRSDRNGNIQILSDHGLLIPRSGQFLFPGTLVPDLSYRSIKDKKIKGLTLYQDQFVYLDDKAILSNAWAGKLYSKHQMPGANMVAGGLDFEFFISNGSDLALIKDSKTLWHKKLSGEQIADIRFDSKKNRFLVLSSLGLYAFQTENPKLKKIYNGQNLRCFTLASKGDKIIIGTKNGYLILDSETSKPEGPMQQNLPATNISIVEEIDGELWFGTDAGAFMLTKDKKFNYYYGQRWIPDNSVKDISAGPDQSVLILTKTGLGIIHFVETTLHDKAVFYERQVRQRHIRNGFNATLSHIKNGDVTTGILSDSDNDGLWTTMYLGGEIFRYAVTKSPEALQNCRESMDALERLYTINPVPGFPSRSFERSGYIPQLADPHRWQQANDPEWVWKATTSSDEAIGHIFAFGAMAELIDDEALKNQAVYLIDHLMQHIIDNDLYLIDYNGKPTQWGRWNPDYVNSMPKTVGDRKLNSSNIIAMLQTAYHFTKKEIYKNKAFELMDKYGYFENLMRPMSEIGRAPKNADKHSKNLSGSWNHSDDEMYFVGYWGLYRYAFNDTLKAKYKDAIIDHWQAERPEKEGLWNLITAITGTSNFDLDEAAWYLREYPLDLITWGVKNSHRQDIEKFSPDFRHQTTKEVLPPDELRISRHNSNRFTLDGGSNGNSEYSAGDIWLLSYWLGRYLGVISSPQNNTGVLNIQ